MNLTQFASAWKPAAKLSVVTRYEGKFLIFEEYNDDPKFKERNKKLLESGHGLTIAARKGEYVRIEERC